MPVINQKDVSSGVTAFIDILGFSDRVIDAKTEHDITAIYQDVKLVREAFDFKSRDDLTRSVQRMYKTTVLAFSDCVVVNIPLESDATKVEGTFDPIMSEITSFAYGQGTCCLNSLFLRGGLDLGWWFRQGSTLISQSMVNAYKAEGAASVPVISVTNKLYDYFAKHEHRHYYSEDFDPFPKTFRSFRHRGNRIRYLDYITICLESLGWQHSGIEVSKFRSASPEEKDEIIGAGYRHNINEWLNIHARNIETEHAAAKEQKVKEKYKWLSAYHNEISQSFTTNPECQCQV